MKSVNNARPKIIDSSPSHNEKVWKNKNSVSKVKLVELSTLELISIHRLVNRSGIWVSNNFQSRIYIMLSIVTF